MRIPEANFKNLKLEVVEDRIVLLTIDRPQVLNALNEATLAELEAAFAGPLLEPAAGAVVVTGAGDKAFVAGADIKELAQLDPLSARQRSIRGQAVFNRIERFPKPVIAAINGYCLGGGCELALACQLRVAARKARIGLPEVKLGIVPGFGGTQRLARLVGKGKAMEMILSGESVDGVEAERMGLVNRAISGDRVLPVCLELASKILANGPLAVRYSIEVMNSGLEMPFSEAARLEASFFALSFASQDSREGVAAFLEKREPRFRGC